MRAFNMLRVFAVLVYGVSRVGRVYLVLHTHLQHLRRFGWFGCFGCLRRLGCLRCVNRLRSGGAGATVVWRELCSCPRTQMHARVCLDAFTVLAALTVLPLFRFCWLCGGTSQTFYCPRTHLASTKKTNASTSAQLLSLVQ